MAWGISIFNNIFRQIVTYDKIKRHKKAAKKKGFPHLPNLSRIIEEACHFISLGQEIKSINLESRKY